MFGTYLDMVTIMRWLLSKYYKGNRSVFNLIRKAAILIYQSPTESKVLDITKHG